MIQPLLQVNDLSIITNKNVVLVNQINFHIHAAEVVGLVGESGSGKTLTAMAILKLLNTDQLQTHGTIAWGPAASQPSNLLNYSTHDIEKIRGAQIGFIFQEPMTSLNPVMKCGEQVAEMLMKHLHLSSKDAYTATLGWFEKVKLDNPTLIYHKYPHQLSGGQKQRIMIAIAICCKPKLIIADEPTTALDATVQAAIIKLLLDLQAEFQMAMLFISHNMPLVSQVANRILVMYNGNIIEQNSTQQIIQNPVAPYTQALMACLPQPGNKGKLLLTINQAIGGNQSTTPAHTERHNQAAQAPILQLSNLSVQYDTTTAWFSWKEKKTTAIQHIHLQLMQGQTLGILGESGSGKSTLAKCIVKMLSPAHGHIYWHQNDIATFNKQALFNYRKQVQIIFQDPYAALNPRMTVGKAIQEPMETFQLGHKSNYADQAIELLNQVGLSAQFYYRLPHQLSGGQRQRVVIARALAVQPQLLICDESVSSLDVSVQAQILNLLNHLKQTNQLSYIFISHDINVVNYMSDYVAIMHQGQVIEQGSTQQIYHTPTSAYTKSLLQAMPILKY